MTPLWGVSLCLWTLLLGITPVERGKGVDMIRTPQVLVTSCTVLSVLGGDHSLAPHAPHLLLSHSMNIKANLLSDRTRQSPAFLALNLAWETKFCRMFFPKKYPLVPVLGAGYEPFSRSWCPGAIKGDNKKRRVTRDLCSSVRVFQLQMGNSAVFGLLSGDGAIGCAHTDTDLLPWSCPSRQPAQWRWVLDLSQVPCRDSKTGCNNCLL